MIKINIRARNENCKISLRSLEFHINSSRCIRRFLFLSKYIECKSFLVVVSIRALNRKLHHAFSVHFKSINSIKKATTNKHTNQINTATVPLS